MSLITKYVRDAMRLYLSDPTAGFNAKLAQVAPTYGIQSITVDWKADTSKQYFEAFMTPDDIDESTASKYPMVFAHGIGSDNSHDAMPRTFSGQVQLALAFWFTDRATRAPKSLEATCDAVEDVINSMFTNGNWPQLYGATNAICSRIPAQRSRIEAGGEMWRQSILFRLTFQVDN